MADPVCHVACGRPTLDGRTFPRIVMGRKLSSARFSLCWNKFMQLTDPRGTPAHGRASDMFFALGTIGFALAVIGMAWLIMAP